MNFKTGMSIPEIELNNNGKDNNGMVDNSEDMHTSDKQRKYIHDEAPVISNQNESNTRL